MKKYKAILWDIDDTLLDFKKSEKYGIVTCFQRRGLYVDDVIAKRFSVINESFWKRLEKNELTKIEVLRGRFYQLFEELQLTDVDVETFRKEYESLIGEVWFYKEDSLKLLEYLQSLSYHQFAITNGTQKVQEKKIKGAGFDKIFEKVFISDVIGTPKPQKAFFDYVLTHTGDLQKKDMLIVGDSLTSDMRGGVENQIDTCWYNPLKKDKELSLPITYEIHSLKAVLDILEEPYGEII